MIELFIVPVRRCFAAVAFSLVAVFGIAVSASATPMFMGLGGG